MFFFNHLLTTTRSFSTSAVQLFPKLKSHSGAKKRWRSLSSGKFKRAHAYHKHLNVNKSSEAIALWLAMNKHGHAIYLSRLHTTDLRLRF
ncbi:hypothetical protein QCA50_019313 [Cerrena zonata]|uniref:50S ribosomal protein L35 n=1 Tax=Cerrena zonata TaxID=2478898 RepID=A0AAW0FKA0_9APHY